MSTVMKAPRLRWWAALGAILCAWSLWPSAPAGAQEDPSQQKISLDLVDADLRDAIALIFKDTPLNHVIGDGVYGTGVTLKLDGVPRERALKILLDSKGLQYTKEGGVYMIKPKAGAAGAGGGMGMPGGGMGAAPGAMPGGPGGGVVGPAVASGGEGGGGSAPERKKTIHQIKLTHLDPWYLYAILMGQAAQGGASGGQFGGVGGGSFGGFGGGGIGGGFGGGLGGGGFGGGGLGGGFGGGGLGGGSFGGGGLGGGSFGGGGLGGGSFGGGGLGGGSFGGGGGFGGGTNGTGSFSSGQQVFRPTLKR